MANWKNFTLRIIFLRSQAIFAQAMRGIQKSDHFFTINSRKYFVGNYKRL